MARTRYGTDRGLSARMLGTMFGIGLLYVILAAVQAGGWVALLAIVAVLNAAVAAFYYLRVIVYLFMREPASPGPEVATPPLLRAGLLLAAVGTVALGLAPTPWIEAVVRAIAP